MQWNVLFSVFAKESKDCCPEKFLDPAHRMDMQLHYIAAYAPDILTLQEFDHPSSPGCDRFCKELKALGYEGLVHAKCRPNADACAIFWKANVLRAAPKPELRLSYAEADASGKCANDVQVALAVELLHGASGRSLVVATTHLKAAKLAEGDRVTQMLLLLQGLEEWATRSAEWIVCGDLNTSPKWEVLAAVSGWRRGSPASSQLQSGQDPSAGAVGSPPPRVFGSVYGDHESLLFTDRVFTVYMPHTQDMVDYMFHTAGLVAEEALKVPGERQIVQQSVAEAPRNVKFRQLPIPSFPSDHLPLVCKFGFAA